MGEVAVRQAILHALVASAVVEATLRAWGIRRAESRLRFWLLALAVPCLVLPLLLVAVPLRLTDRFAAGWALFAGGRWGAVRVAGVPLDGLVFDALMVAGTLLLLRDVVPFLLSTFRERREGHAAAQAPATPLADLAAEVAVRVGAGVPAIAVVPTDAPLLFVRGVLRKRLIVSDGVVARLSSDQLRAALAHELAHVRFRDPLAGWLLMIVRLVMFWNPAVQLTTRAIVQEMEHRADDVASEIAGRATFAEALRRLGACAARDLGVVEPLTERMHRAHIEARVESVLAPAARASASINGRLAVVGATLGVLVFFIV